MLFSHGLLVLFFKAAPGDKICMCIKEPKLVQLFYDMMGMEDVYNKDTGYAKICGKCEIELEGHMGNKGIMKVGTMNKFIILSLRI